MQTLHKTIQDPDGIHARPAGILVKTMQDFTSNFVIAKGDKTADGKRLFALMKLAVRQGDAITITAEGQDEAAAIAAVQAVFDANSL